MFMSVNKELWAIMKVCLSASEINFSSSIDVLVSVT